MSRTMSLMISSFNGGARSVLVRRTSTGGTDVETRLVDDLSRRRKMAILDGEETGDECILACETTNNRSMRVD